MSHLSDEVRAESVMRMREAATMLEHGSEVDAGRLLLAGLKPVAIDLKRRYGPMVRLMIGSWLRSVFEE